MNKTKKRQLNIKNKLIAAIAMLLVSSIMMVSTTYAWFTLSTAPEVQGITTTVGANGNLEIALSPADGDYNKITSGIGDANIDWVDRNKTWGNLLDLSDDSYRLDELTLLPSQLNIAPGTATTPATLKDNPLAIPVYGADGRISMLDGTKVTTGGYQELTNGAAGFMVNNIYGVRALGTSSDMSPDAIAFNSALSAMGTSTNAANNIVTTALNNYGSALADMAVKHASVGDSTDTNDYVQYSDELQNMSAEMVNASAEVENALYNALLALAKSSKATDVGITDELYQKIKTAKEEGSDLRNIWAEVPVSQLSANEYGMILVNSYNKWETTDDAVITNQQKVNNLSKTDTDGDGIIVGWSEVSSAMSGLMNVNKVTISGYPMDQVMNKIVEIMGSGGVTLQLNAGSGVIANFGELTGNILSAVKLSEGLAYNNGSTNISLGGLNVNIVTTTEPAAGPLLVQTKSLVTALGVKPSAEGEENPSLIDVIYGYAVDFVFRTNAANSNLLLQTEGVQRIYGDSENAATMGNGSTITFGGTTTNLDSLISMMSGIRVVFTDTKGNEVYGIAKVVFDETPLIINGKSVTRVVTAVEDEDEDGKGLGTYTYTVSYNEGSETNQEIKITADVLGNATLKTADHVYVVRETVTNDDGTSYVRWALKTAMYYTETVKYTTTNEAGVDVEVTEEVEVEVMKDGKPVFYEQATEDLVNDDHAVTLEDDKATIDMTVVTVVNGETTSEGVTTTITGASASEMADKYVAPVYLHVYDKAIELEGPLALYEYGVHETTGALVFYDPLDVPALTTLDQNVATGVTAMVYLDGDYVDNADVTNSEDGISNTGTLNLQFASSANLVPMQDTTLMNGVGVEFINQYGDVKVNGLTTANKTEDYTFSLTVGADEKVTYSVYAICGANYEEIATGLAADSTTSCTVNGGFVQGNVTIVILPSTVSLADFAALNGITLPSGT